MNQSPFHRVSTRHIFRAFSLITALTLPLGIARAQSSIGSIISYQGQLSNTNGTPIADGTTALTFKIYEAGTEKSSQTMSVATFGGVFNTFLSVGALSFDPTKAYELGITFNNVETRHPIAAVPVALNAKSAASVSGVVPVANGGTGSATKPFVDLTTAQTVAGAKTFSSAVTVPQVNIGANRVLGTGGSSVFVGTSAGAANGNANDNVFVGSSAGAASTGRSNTFVGNEAGQNNTSADRNIALGDQAGSNWTTGSDNIAIGSGSGVAGESRTTRIGLVQTNTFIAGIRGATGLTGTLPVVVDASGQLGTAPTDATALSGVVPVANGGTGSSTKNFVDLTSTQTVGGAKTFSGALAVPQVNIGGSRILGTSSSVSGVFVGRGAGAASANTSFNVFVGGNAGTASTGQQNVFVGDDAGLTNTSGNFNTALGDSAGKSWTTGSNNIAIKNGGVSGESGTTRIGTQGAQTRAFIAGISGVAVAGTPVIIDANGQLGTVNSSSGRFKQDVHSIGASSDWLLKLRPVSFRYTPAFLKSDAPSPVQYGLIAEEVAKVAPQMVHLDAQGRPNGVDYGNLPVMLLNQLQQQQKVIAALEAKNATQDAKNTALEARLKKLEGAFAR